MIYPEREDFTIEQRASFLRSFAIKDAAGAALNLTGSTLVASLWTERRQHLLDFTFAWTTQSQGKFTLALTAAQTTTLSGAAVWDVLGTDGSGKKSYYLRGQVLIEPGFTI